MGKTREHRQAVVVWYVSGCFALVVVEVDYIKKRCTKKIYIIEGKTRKHRQPGGY